MRQQQAKPAPRGLAIAHLKEAQIIGTTMRLPPEILDKILDALSVQDLLRWARVSKRVKKLIYDDVRWISRLEAMQCWPIDPVPTEEVIPMSTSALSLQRSAILGRYPTSPATSIVQETTGSAAAIVQDDPFSVADLVSLQPRAIYGAIHARMQPCYRTVVSSKDDHVIFPGGPLTPVQYASAISHIARFSGADFSIYGSGRRLKVAAVTEALEGDQLKQFRANLDARDFESARLNVKALEALGRAEAGVWQFIDTNSLFVVKESLGDPEECLSDASSGKVDFEPAERFMAILTNEIIKQSENADKCFPIQVDVMTPFLNRLGSDVLAPYASYLFDEASRQADLAFVTAVPGFFTLCLRLQLSMKMSHYLDDRGLRSLQRVIDIMFEPRMEVYMSTEQKEFEHTMNAAIDSWDQRHTQQVEGHDRRFAESRNRQADKRDFLASFKKVVLMPINVMPLLAAKPNHAQDAPAADSEQRKPVEIQTAAALSAQATRLDSGSDSIKSLLSVDLTIGLIQSAKAVIERIAVFVRGPAEWSTRIKERCQLVFIKLLLGLSTRHLDPGINQAIKMLSQAEQGKEQSIHDALVGFADLINVCDLIQQMLEVFYEEEMGNKQLSSRDAFTDMAAKEKKSFEQSLDDRVASGLNQGIEAIFTQIGAILTSKQLVTDYDPEAALYDVSNASTNRTQQKKKSGQLDFATTPTSAATAVCDMLRASVESLQGTIDANMLDVFYAEMGQNLFEGLRNHVLRLRISMTGAMQLMIDMAAYYEFVTATLCRAIRNQPTARSVSAYFEALRRLGDIYLVSGDAKVLLSIIGDQERWRGVFEREELVKLVSRRADWISIKREVEKGTEGTECVIM